MSIYLGNNLIAPNQPNAANKSLSNLNSDGEKHFLNKSQVSNCILEAPNGILTSSGNTFTAKAGLKVLIPNGKNADGTLNNIEYTLENDVSNTASSGGNNYIYSIYLDSDGQNRVTFTIREPDCYTLPTTQYNGSRIIYNITENKFYWTPSGTPNWSERKLAIIGTYLYSNNSVTNLRSEQPINILKQSDKSQIGGWGMPSGTSVDLTLGASGAQYTAPANGYVSIAKVAQGVGQYIEINVQDRIRTNMLSSVSTGFGLKLFVPVRRGETFNINYNTSGNLEIFKFTYAEGEVQ